MRIEALDVVLRPRSAWEAVELGAALVRRHARAIWTPLLAITLPVFALLNLLCWFADTLWLAPLVMWWLKPAFDRVPLFVLSRAVFGEVPDTRATLRAQATFGRRWMPAYLTWRRLSPARALNMPIDLLEGATGAAARARRSALGGSMYGVASLMTLVFVNFEFALVIGAALLVVLFIPDGQLDSVARAIGPALLDLPRWLELAYGAASYAAAIALAPFYVGGGFGLYLNRRTGIEAWDVEIALRRLRGRLLSKAAPLLLAVAACGMAVLPHRADAQARAADTARTSGTAAPTLPGVFGRVEDDASLRRAVAQANADPRVSPKRTLKQWVRRTPAARKAAPRMPAWLRGVGEGLGFAGRVVAWSIVGLLVLALLLTAPKWLRWMRGAVQGDARVVARPVEQDAIPLERLPDDVPTAARALWAHGRQRDALALVYRAVVESMAQRAQLVLPPGATEAECLRASRRLPEIGDRDAFAGAVRVWQYAAYAQRLPDDAGFAVLLDGLAARFDWSRA